jgi:hypothetical protein
MPRRLLEGKMPRATVVKTTERKDLTTVPNGWVELRRLSFGEKMAKDAEAMRMKFDMDGAAKGDTRAEFTMINVETQMREFALCVMDHNLTKPNPADPENEDVDLPLNFKNKVDVAELDPRVGDEISQLIGEMNDFVRAVQEERDAQGKS